MLSTAGSHNRRTQNIGGPKQKGPEFVGALSRNFLIPIRDAADYFFFLVAAFFFPFLAAFFID